MDQIRTIARLGLRLGCPVCPSPTHLRLYGVEGLLHEIGHFAIAPAFMRRLAEHAAASIADERPPVPAADAFAVGIDTEGNLLPYGTQLCDRNGHRVPGVAVIAENPLPLTDWHVRAWTAEAARLLGLTPPRRLWLGSSPWWDLLYSASLEHHNAGRPGGWGDRHPERAALWESRARAGWGDERRELHWRLEDLEEAGVLDQLRAASTGAIGITASHNAGDLPGPAAGTETSQ